WHCNRLLWKDRLGQISLATTTLFWGAGATLQFIVLDWAFAALGLTLDKATLLQGVVAIGIAVGAVMAARFVPLRRSPNVLPIGIGMGLLVVGLAFYHRGIGPEGAVAVPFSSAELPLYVIIAGLILTLIGALAGFFVVPMNALLQHRGHILMGAGHSIAVQNFNENISILVMLAGYTAMKKAALPIPIAIIMFGLFVAGSMVCVLLRHRYNQRQGDSTHLIARDHH
ncbi:MAG: lysophospholipid transporter LplT, partial [Burkholderiales bacterium]